ncbi:hypothetical protein LTR37_010502 [Vermiconidia calcicola]|uniref:Uncharacterized protein n=1 Tax=Vermiconidia calcicola TaxID=1690605 RepID=A0ACC3N535_9PEZI|nr:hypothetical protein LTR37_010502 [Vermiconidia calcicola]
MAEKQLEITEHDDAGNITATYVQSAASQSGASRVDVILPTVVKSPWQRALNVFLPTGYPHSVTKDYLEYQIYDSLQAFSSSIAGLLSSRAVLSSVGVGDSTASPTAALLLSILQESAGRVATILFADRFGTSLEPECKMYRLLADVLNDIAFILDCLSPVFPKPIRVVILSFSSVLRALCGVAAGSAKASLSAHFARWGNLGELNAKDSSQETVISLLGMLAGSLVVTWVTTPFATWTALILLLSVHLETNRRAVRAVSMRTLNRQRATLVYHHLKTGHIPTPEAISKEEHIFERDGVLRAPDRRLLGHCSIGSSMVKLLGKVSTQAHTRTNSSTIRSDLLPRLLAVFKDRKYTMWCENRSSSAKFDVVIKTGASSLDLLTAWWQALEFASAITDEEIRLADSSHTEAILERLKDSAQTAGQLLRDNEVGLREAGWALDLGALETASGVRIAVAAV